MEQKEQLNKESAELRKELVLAREALAALQIQSDNRVKSLEQTAAADMEQALRRAAQRSQQEQAALRKEFDIRIQQEQASQRIAASRFDVEQAAILDRAERAEYENLQPSIWLWSRHFFGSPKLYVVCVGIQATSICGRESDLRLRNPDWRAYRCC